MKSVIRLSFLAAFAFTAGLFGLGFPDNSVASDVPPVGPSGPVGGGSPSSGGGVRSGGGGAIERWFRERQEAYERERQEERRNEQEYRATVDRWSRMVQENEEQYRAQQERDLRTQQENLSKARQTAKIMHAWNDMGIEAYRAADFGNSITYFRAAQRYAPESIDIKDNLRNANYRLGRKAESYLVSLGTALRIYHFSPKALLLHPDPNVRAEANRKLVKETMQKIAESAAAFIAEERLNGGKIEPFPWETEAERMERRQEAIRHAQKVESLRLDALKEAHELSEHVIVSDLIQIQTKPATQQLLKICISGFR